MQTARLAKLLRKQQETRSPSHLPALAANWPELFSLLSPGKQHRHFAPHTKSSPAHTSANCLTKWLVAGGQIAMRFIGWCIIVTFLE